MGAKGHNVLQGDQLPWHMLESLGIALGRPLKAQGLLV
jgi:hypothetical protein